MFIIVGLTWDFILKMVFFFKCLPSVFNVLPLTMREVALLTHADLWRVDQEADRHRPAHGGADSRVAWTALVHLQQGQVARGPACQRHHVVINAIWGNKQTSIRHSKCISIKLGFKSNFWVKSELLKNDLNDYIRLQAETRISSRMKR